MKPANMKKINNFLVNYHNLKITRLFLSQQYQPIDEYLNLSNSLKSVISFNISFKIMH